jgi:hypothetical protein
MADRKTYLLYYEYFGLTDEPEKDKKILLEAYDDCKFTKLNNGLYLETMARWGLEDELIDQLIADSVYESNEGGDWVKIKGV